LVFKSLDGKQHGYFLKKLHYYLLGAMLISIAFGILFFLIQRDIILIRWVSGSQRPYSVELARKSAVSRKQIKYYFWKEEKFQTEDGTLICKKGNIAGNLKRLINNWITCLQDENLIKRNVFVESVALSSFNEEVFLSFNRPLLSKEWPVIKKWYLIESLFKTVRDAKIPIRSFKFLVNHHHMIDDHLDFSQPWPLDGFIID